MKKSPATLRGEGRQPPKQRPLPLAVPSLPAANSQAGTHAGSQQLPVIRLHLGFWLLVLVLAARAVLEQGGRSLRCLREGRDAKVGEHGMKETALCSLGSGHMN